MANINTDEIGIIVDRIISKAKDCSSPHMAVVATRDVKQAIRPVVQKYSPLADRCQKVSREVRDIAYFHLNSHDFTKEDHPPFGTQGEYFFRYWPDSA